MALLQSKRRRHAARHCAVKNAGEGSALAADLDAAKHTATAVHRLLQTGRLRRKHTPWAFAIVTSGYSHVNACGPLSARRPRMRHGPVALNLGLERERGLHIVLGDV